MILYKQEEANKTLHNHDYDDKAKTMSFIAMAILAKVKARQEKTKAIRALYNCDEVIPSLDAEIKHFPLMKSWRQILWF